MICLTQEPIDTSRILTHVASHDAGAVVLFLGTTREFTHGRQTASLEYECYAEMAEKKMAEIGAEVRQKFAVGEIAMVHRLGALNIGESSIVIAVAAPHRHAAFEACAYAMDRVKEAVPIWKKEFFDDGEAHWVNQN